MLTPLTRRSVVGDGGRITDVLEAIVAELAPAGATHPCFGEYRRHARV
jgi:hypothetical protein